MDYIFTEDDSSNKNLWHYLKGRWQDSFGVSTLVSGGKSLLDPCTKADMLNCQFSSVFTKEDVNHLPQKNPSCYPVMSPIVIHNAGVYKLLSRLNQRKASSNITMSCVRRTYSTNCFFCTCSCLSSFMHCFRIECSTIAVHCDYCVTRHPWRTLLVIEPEPEPAI